MQRRAAAVYFVLFVLIGAGAYGFMQVGMSEPTVDLDGSTYSEGDELTVGDRTYTVDAISTEEGEIARFEGEVDLVWTNESRRASATLENDSTVDRDDGEFRVVVTGNETFALVEVQDVEAILAADPEVENRGPRGRKPDRHARRRGVRRLPREPVHRTPLGVPPRTRANRVLSR